MIGLPPGTIGGDINNSNLGTIAYGFKTLVNVFAEAGLQLGRMGRALPVG